MPKDLHAAWRFNQGVAVADEEFALQGITQLPWNLQKLTLAGLLQTAWWAAKLDLCDDFNQSRLALDFVMDCKAWRQALQPISWSWWSSRLDFSLPLQSKAGPVPLPAGLRRFSLRVTLLIWWKQIRSGTRGTNRTQFFFVCHNVDSSEIQLTTDMSNYRHVGDKLDFWTIDIMTNKIFWVRFVPLVPDRIWCINACNQWDDTKINLLARFLSYQQYQQLGSWS